jgi:diguanylate cyclase (GGDEF)-like protein
MMPAWRSPFRSLRSRLVLFFPGLLVVVLAVTALLVYLAIAGNARERVAEELGVGERVFLRLLEDKSRQFTQAAGVLSLDFAFREAAATRDLDTIRSVLANHGARIGADVAALVSLEREIIAQTRDPQRSGRRFPYGALIDAAERDGRAAAIVVEDGRAYELAVAPVLAPVPIAWAVYGFVVDDKLAADLKTLSRLDVSFFACEAGGAWRRLASTVAPPLQDALLAALPARGFVPGQAGATLTLAGDEYGTLLVPLQQSGDTLVVAVLQRSLEELLAPFTRLLRVLLALAAGAMVAAGLGALFIARGVTRPLSQLADLTRRIEDGDYSRPVEVGGTDEVAALARRFDEMRRGISRREDQISRLAYRDVLTGLPNRTLFNDRLQVAVEVARRASAPLAVLLMDLDRFKYVNDTLGHPAGDLVLKEVGRRLQDLLRKSDTIARLGGDEFAMLLNGAGVGEASAVAQKIALVLEEPIALAPHAVDIRASVGVACMPEHGDDAEALVRHADVAMYVAKRANAGFAVYEPGRDERREEQLTLLSELRRAIDQDQLRLAFQPKIALLGGELAGVEALVRWEHPERGLVPPMQFIPFAEQTGFIRPITRWVLEAAVKQAAAWRAAGRSIKVSANISVQDLLNPELPGIVTGALERHALPPSLLCLEITESGVMQDAAGAIEVLRRLHAIGVGRSIDDFGTGQSSLAYMKQLMVDEVKIDRSFVRGIVHDKKDAAIVLSTIELGHNLGMTVVAEGVEDEASSDALRRLGCDQAQGYLFTAPLEAAALIEWVTARESRLAAISS